MEGKQIDQAVLIARRLLDFFEAIASAADRAWLVHLDRCSNKRNSILELPEKWLANTCLNIILHFRILLWKSIAFEEPAFLVRDTQLFNHLVDDCVRMFASLENMDFERAVWGFMTEPDTCEPAFRRFRNVSMLAPAVSYGSRIWYYCGMCTMGSLPRCDCALRALGNALCQVSCHLTRQLSPSPSPPPPPYTLYAFNIELPPLFYAGKRSRSPSVGRTLRTNKRRRSDSEDVEHICKQRLLRFKGKQTVQRNTETQRGRHSGGRLWAIPMRVEPGAVAEEEVNVLLRDPGNVRVEKE